PAGPLPFGYYTNENGNITTTEVGILSGDSPEHQTLFPKMASGKNLFNPGYNSFGLFTKTGQDHFTYTEDALNPGNGPNNEIKHLVRIYPLKDREGKSISNSYLVGFEEALNGDYQDYVFVIKNVRPVIAVAPTMTFISNPAAILMNSGIQTISLSGISAGEGESQSISIKATSSNKSLIPDPAVQYTSPNNTATLTYTPVSGASGQAIITVTVTDSGPNMGGHENTLTRVFTVIVNGANNNAPTLDPIANPEPINQDAPAQTINLTGITAGPGDTGQTITITATSDNPGLIPQPTVNFNGTGTTGTLTYTPVAGAYGFALITVIVEDNGVSNASDTNTFSQSFIVEVRQVNKAPAISEIGPQYVDINQTLGPLDFTLTDEDTELDDLELEGTSDNQDLIPDSNIVFGGSGGNRTLIITPKSEESGEALVTIYVYDGLNRVERSFILHVGKETSVDEVILKNKILLYPNPASSEVEIVLENNRMGKVDIGILDISGKYHKQTSYEKHGESMKITMNVELLPKGVYILRINENGYITSKRFIKL
ncbi:MAG: T9SS type A sorting domain-containing protein, partial [Bacteroidota bacterium]|nr:T9SS type A sorting domain-containing protein [Bacteroidota bacterium]